MIFRSTNDLEAFVDRTVRVLTPILLCSGGVKILLSQWCDRLSLIGCESEALELAPRTTSLASSLALSPSTSHPQLIFTPPRKRYPNQQLFTPIRKYVFITL